MVLTVPRTIIALALLLLPSTALGYRYKHEILPGETLGSIAQRYHLSVKQLKRQNRRRLRHGLRAGRSLRVKTSYPASQRIKSRYAVKKGDSLGKIARKFKMKLRLLRRLNPKLKGRRLRVGMPVTVVVQGPRPKSTRGMYQLFSGPGYEVRSGRRSWGTFLSVTRIMEVLAAHARAFPRGRGITVGDLSKKGGGFLEPHKSHRRGRDVDIFLPLKGEDDRIRKATTKTLDIPRTWDLIRRFIDTGDVTYIFLEHRLQRVVYKYARSKGVSKRRLTEIFQYPRGPNRGVGIVRHEPGHATHLHVRFVKEKRPPKPNS